MPIKNSQRWQMPFYLSLRADTLEDTHCDEHQEKPPLSITIAKRTPRPKCSLPILAHLYH